MRKLFAISVCLIFALSACIPTFGQQTEAIDPAAAAQTAIAGTKVVEDAVATSVAQTAAANQPPPAATTEPPPAATTEPQLPTEPPAPTATLKSNANCRSGPAGNFDFIVLLNAGESGKVIGKNADFGKPWYKLELADGKQCWVSSEALTISGSTASIPDIASPPTPTPKPPPNWTGTWKVWMSGGISYPDREEVTLYINMVQTGNTITYTYTSWGQTFNFSGTVSADGMNVTGHESGNFGYSGDVLLVRNPSNLNQFRGRWWVGGNTSLDGTYCGSINNAPRPDPCRP